MILTDAEYSEVLETLQKHGIEGSDATTSLRTLCIRAGDVDFSTWLERVRRIVWYETRVERDRMFAEAFGNDAIRAADVLACRHRTVAEIARDRESFAASQKFAGDFWERSRRWILWRDEDYSI